MKKYGYIRVSTKDQNPERQFIALQEYDIPKENIYLDQMSGRDFLRPQYQRLMKALRKGDLLVVKSIDRLGRNYGEILEQWRNITKETGAHIRVIDMPLLNTDSVQGDLTGYLFQIWCYKFWLMWRRQNGHLSSNVRRKGLRRRRRRGFGLAAGGWKIPIIFGNILKCGSRGRSPRGMRQAP